MQEGGGRSSTFAIEENVDVWTQRSLPRGTAVHLVKITRYSTLLGGLDPNQVESNPESVEKIRYLWKCGKAMDV